MSRVQKGFVLAAALVVSVSAAAAWKDGGIVDRCTQAEIDFYSEGILHWVVTDSDGIDREVLRSKDRPENGVMFFYRAGDMQTIKPLGVGVAEGSGVNTTPSGGKGESWLSVKYGYPGFDVTVNYEAECGPGSTPDPNGFCIISQLHVGITVPNTSDQPITFDLFQYVNLSNPFTNTSNDNLVITVKDGEVMVVQKDPDRWGPDRWYAGEYAKVTSGNATATLVRIDAADEDGKLSAELRGLGVNNLKNLDSLIASGDVEWAIQWTVTLAPKGQAGDTLTIEQKLFIAQCCIPEPATMSLLALGGLAALRRRRK